MGISQELLTSGEPLAVGIAGGKGRNYFTNLLASDLVRQGKKVVISHLKIGMLPVAGNIICDEDEKSLLKKVSGSLESESIVYVGSGMKDNLVTGILPDFANNLLSVEAASHFLFVLGDVNEYSILLKKDILNLKKLAFIDQLIYFFQMDTIDKPLDPAVIKNVARFKTNFPYKSNPDTLNHQRIVDYLVNKEKGLLSLFIQKRPAALIFSDVQSMLLENKAINLARDLFGSIKTIYTANFREDIIKRIPNK